MKNEKITSIIARNPLQAIALLITIISLVTTMLAVYITSRLSPLSENLAVISGQVSANADRDDREHPTFVSQNEFKIHNETVYRIEGKLDKVYELLNK